VADPVVPTKGTPRIGGNSAMILPSTLNVLVIGMSVIVFGFLWRMAAAKMSDSPWGQAMATIW
jgi:hypothetical protein